MASHTSRVEYCLMNIHANILLYSTYIAHNEQSFQKSLDRFENFVISLVNTYVYMSICMCLYIYRIYRAFHWQMSRVKLMPDST